MNNFDSELTDREAFISYSFGDSEERRKAIDTFLKELRNRFKEEYGSVYAASRRHVQSDVHAGEGWPPQLCNQIRHSLRLILLLDERSAQSKECLKEVLLAEGAGVPVFAYDIESGSVPLELKKLTEEDGLLRYLLEAKEAIASLNSKGDLSPEGIAIALMNAYKDDRENRSRDHKSREERAAEIAGQLAATLSGLDDVSSDPHSEFQLVRSGFLNMGRLLNVLRRCDAVGYDVSTILDAAVFAAEQPAPGPDVKVTLKKAALVGELPKLVRLLEGDLDAGDIAKIILRASRSLLISIDESPQVHEPGILVDIKPARYEVRLGDMADYTQHKLEDYLRSSEGTERTLTPVLGTGALQIRSRARVDAEPGDDEDVIVWDASIVDHAKDRGQEDGGRRAAFLADVLGSRSEGRYLYSETDSNTAVSAVRIALLELAYLATQAFLEVLAENPSTIADWEDLDVALPYELTEGIVRAGWEALDSLDASCNGAFPELLGAADLCAKLRAFIRELTDRDHRALRDARLSGKRVEWITDVFWHSMIFNSPMYPGMDELALQVSLVDGSNGAAFRYPLQRLEPAASVYRFDVDSFNQAVRECVRRGYVEDRDAEYVPFSARRAFFGGLADSLMGDFVSWKRDSRMPRQEDSFTIAVVTTFDLELERALMRSRHGEFYHVALPVLVRQGGKRAELRWIVGTFPTAQPVWVPQSGGRRELQWFSKHTDAASSQLELLRSPPPPYRWQWLDEMERARNSDHIDWRGPLVLRVNGSPLHEIPEDTKHMGRSTVELSDDDNVEPLGIHHAVSIAEFDFLQVSRSHIWANSSRLANTGSGGDSAIRQGLPREILRALRHSSRYWMLAGCRLVDWNSRMQLFMYLPEHLRYAVGEKSSATAIAINKRFDPDRVRVLTWLGVQPYEGDLSELTPKLAEYADSIADNTEREV